MTPWLVRNKVQLGCWTMTTDGRALWKANNLQTYGLLSPASGSTTSHELAAADAAEPANAGGRVRLLREARPDVALPRTIRTSASQMSFYEHLTIAVLAASIRANKAKLAALSVKLLWQPNVFETSGRQRRRDTTSTSGAASSSPPTCR